MKRCLFVSTSGSTPAFIKNEFPYPGGGFMWREIQSNTRKYRLSLILKICMASYLGNRQWSYVKCN